MGYALPSGVINTDSVYFYADATATFGPLVKQLQDQTLVVLDYTLAAISINSFDFAVDVSSNPKLVIGYPQIDPTGFVLTFLLSGGIPSQQYNISVLINSGGDTDAYILTVNIPSSGDCACETINPVPALYTQLPLGSQGYVNSATRYFWGSAPPINPNVMDQWFNASTQTLYERASDGTNFFWQTIASPQLVMDAPSSGLIYGRYNGFWVPEPVQSDAPQDGNQYARFMGGWRQVAAIFPDAPSNNTRYGRYNGVWQADAIQTDAPSNANIYGRAGGAWTVLPPIIPEAPQTSQLYSRINSNWQLDPIQSDAPTDGNFYGRNNNMWIMMPQAGIDDAPPDGTLYGRLDGGWAAAYPESNPSNYQSGAQVTTALTAFMPKVGGTFTGGVAFSAGAIFASPVNLNVGGGTVDQVLSATGTGGLLVWNDPGPPEAPEDGIAYARQNGGWVPTASGAGIPEAPNDGTAYARSDISWVHLDHADITDWNATLAPYALTANLPAIPGASATTPLMDGVAAVGTGTTWARADHVHPTDTTRYAASNPSGYQTALQVTTALGPYALITSLPVADNAVPLMDGTASAGTFPAYSRGDHVHPTDTSRLAVTGGTLTGILTLVGNPVNTLDAAPKQYVDSASANANIDCGTF